MSNVKITIQNSKFLKTFYFLLAFLTFTFCLLTFTLYATPIHAQTSTPSASPLPTTNYHLPSTISPTSPIYTDLLIHNMFHTFSCLGIGQSVIGQPCLTYVSGVPVLSQVDLSGGVLGSTTSLITALYTNPPVRTVNYIAYVGKGFGIVKPVNAQVVGSAARVLDPVLRLWEVSRNIAYLIMVIIFVVIGLMVMFRNRINPQTVITAQAALPGLVLGLILITFSYFMAAAISDTAFIGTNAVGYFFAAAQNELDDPQRTNLVQHISVESMLSIFSPFLNIITWDDASKALGAILEKMNGETQFYIRLLAGFISAQLISPLSGAIPPPYGLIASPLINLVAGVTVATFPTTWVGLMLSFIATFALIYQMLKLLLRLLASYLTIIFLTISAPFHFLAAALPGRQSIATGWMLKLLANILVFPAVLAVFYFVAFLMGQDYGGPLKVTQSNQMEESSFVPAVYAADKINIVEGTAFPLFGGLDLGFIKILLAFGALMALPKIPDIIVSAIGKMGQAGQLIGQEVSGGIRGGRGYYEQGAGAIRGQGGMFKQNIFGEKGYYLNPGTGGFEYGPTKPGIGTFIDRSASPWNPLKWKRKSP